MFSNTQTCLHLALPDTPYWTQAGWDYSMVMVTSASWRIRNTLIAYNHDRSYSIVRAREYPEAPAEAALVCAVGSQ